MEQAIFLFAWKRFSIRGIFEARTTGFMKMILQTVFSGMMVACPIILALQEEALKNPSLESQFIMVMYLSLIVLHVIFLLGISVMALALNLTAACTFCFREIFTFLSYASTLPALGAMLIGIFTNVSYVYLVYNFGLLFFAFFVYKKGQRVYVENRYGYAKNMKIREEK